MAGNCVRQITSPAPVASVLLWTSDAMDPTTVLTNPTRTAVFDSSVQ
jgi:hypothetical protein